MVVGKVGELMKELAHLVEKYFAVSHLMGTLPSLRFFLTKSKTKPSSVLIRNGGFTRNFWLRPNTSDLNVLLQIFWAHDYDFSSWRPYTVYVEALCEKIRSQGKLPLIIDAGANIGASSLWFAFKYPLCHIFAIEPEPMNFALLRKNVADCRNITVFNAGLWDKSTNFSTIGTGWGSRVQEAKDGESVIPGVTIPELLARDERLRPVIVKIDIEGAETNLLRSQTEWIDNIPLVIFEQHDNLFHWLGPWQGNGHAFFSVLSRRKREYLSHGENIFAFLHPEAAERVISGGAEERNDNY